MTGKGSAPSAYRRSTSVYQLASFKSRARHVVAAPVPSP